MKNKNYFWRPVSEYTGGRVLATNGLDVLIGEINSDGDCESEEDSGTILCGITGFIKIEEILPESEDERIRKSLIDMLKNDEKCYLKEIAWLEKQGEKKPAWSEEDMAIIDDAIFFIQEFQKSDRCKNESDMQNSVTCERFLIFLKDKVAPQSKQEWSEEDKRKINRIYSILRLAADTRAFSTSCRLISDKECIELQDFLKSLRLQNRWKPSDEQMKVLDEVISNPYLSTAEYNGLIALREQLKAL